jgi:L-iditol 2-dehydrogenase
MTTLPELMKAVVSHGTEDYRMENCPVPSLGKYDVLIENKYCGICGTDIHQFHGSWDLRKGSIPGHEVSGIIREVGSKVPFFKAGQKVSFDPGITCKVCDFCRSAKHHLCPNRYPVYHYKGGGFAEFSCIPYDLVYRLPDQIPLEWGAFLEPASCCLHGINRAAIQPGQSVAVLGGGAIGLILMQLAFLSGAAKVLVSEPNIGRRALAKQLGASITIDPNDQDAVEAINDLSNGGVDVVIESAGLPHTVAQSFYMVKPGGKIVLFGVNAPETRVAFNPYQVFRKEITIVGTVLSGNAFPQTLDLIASEKLRVKPLISHVLPLSSLNEAIGMHERQEGVKILIAPNLENHQELNS